MHTTGRGMAWQRCTVWLPVAFDSKHPAKASCQRCLPAQGLCRHPPSAASPSEQFCARLTELTEGDMSTTWAGSVETASSMM